MCQSKLRTLLFFIHFIYFDLFYYYFYMSPLKVCHHARCTFSVGSTCKVVFFFCWWRFSHIGQLLRRKTWSSGSETQSGQTATTLESPNKRTNMKTPLQMQLQGRLGRGRRALTIIKDSRRVKQKQFSSCFDSCHPIHKRGTFFFVNYDIIHWHL